jgi:aminopeptidase-like protein
LLRHLHVHPRLPDAIPFVFKYYQRDWGLCATQRLCNSLQSEAYRVVIRSRFEPGTLKVGEVIIPGETDTCFMLAAHLCHPAMVNDDLTGVVVGIDVARRLLLRHTRPHYTYRLLVLPETIGSVAYLSHNEALIPNMVGGLFLEMLGNNSPHALQGSFQPDSQVDRCLNAALPDLDASAYTAAYRRIIDNDERQFNSPGVRVPMLSLSRVEAPKAIQPVPYPEYHSSLDTPAIVSQERLEASRETVLHLLEAWEHNAYVVNHFKGEVFCSGYGIWIDHQVNPQGHRRLFEIMERCDGEHTVADIAVDLEISFQPVWEVIRLLQEKGLVSLSWAPQPTSPPRTGH